MSSVPSRSAVGSLSSFEEPPRTAADSARVKARADSVAKAKADSAKADSAKSVIPGQGAPSAPKPDAAKKPLFR